MLRRDRRRARGSRAGVRSRPPDVRGAGQAVAAAGGHGGALDPGRLRPLHPGKGRAPGDARPGGPLSGGTLQLHVLLPATAGAGGGAGRVGGRLAAAILAVLGLPRRGGRVRRRLLLRPAHHSRPLLGGAALRVGHPAGLPVADWRRRVHARPIAGVARAGVDTRALPPRACAWRSGSCSSRRSAGSTCRPPGRFCGTSSTRA